MSRILVMDDEQDLVWAVQQTLEAKGYEVMTAHDGEAGLSLAHQHRPDLVILDIVMPRLDGLQVCQRLRRDSSLADVAILFLTVRSSVEDRLHGLDRGADDYLSKPFDLRELQARVGALLRRSRFPFGSLAWPLVVGPLVLDGRDYRLRVGPKSILLSPTQFQLLYHLMARPGRVFSPRELLQQVWGYVPATADMGLVRWHVKKLREKIEDDPAHPCYVCTVPRYGYMLMACPERTHEVAS